ncbi:MAG: type II toxin-antitoxin system VapB family antitoxin [Nitrospirota bacterium]
MKTLIDIDEKLLSRAVRISGSETKKETVKMALEEFIKLRLRQRLKDMAGSDILDLSLTDLKTSRNIRLKKQADQRKNLK